MSFLTAHAGPSPQQEAHKDSSRPWFHNQDMPGLEMALSLLFLRPILHLSLSLPSFPSLFLFGSSASRNIPPKVADR